MHSVALPWVGMDAILLMYSISSRESFENVANYRQRCILQRGTQAPEMVLVGTKNDLQDDRVVSVLEGQARAEEWNIPFYETSAKTDFNVFGLLLETVKYLKNIRPLRPFPKFRSWNCILL